MLRKFIYFINPISGTKNKSLVLEMISSRTSAANIPFEILHTNAEGNYFYLQEKIAAEKITDIIICGGDGTVNQIANALQKTTVNIGIIPMGSGNGLAFAAKIPKRADKALDIIFKGNSRAIDAFYINNTFSCMLCGLGFDAQVAHDFAKQKKRGLATYVKQSTKNFFKAGTYPFTIAINGNELHVDAFFISIANSNQFGNNFTIAPQASLHDGLLDIVVVNKMSKMKMLWSVLQQIRSGKVHAYEDKKFQRTDIGYFQTKKLTIGNPSNAPLHIDGDPVNTAAQFEIEIIEKAFNLLMP
jgi:YegS/Rv2252/BmrU family lipid kinase